MPAAYLEKFGGEVLDNGYAIVAIRPGEKRPFGKDWETKTFGVKTLAGFIEADRGSYGVGIKARKTPGVDIDCYDEDVVAEMVAFTQDMLGETLQRTGLPPKTLLPYRAPVPFTKTQSKTFVDDEGRFVKLEVLGDGQQWVALHIHPDTGKPYRWKDKKHPGNTPRSELPAMDQEDALAIVAKFEELARAKGWPEKRTASKLDSTRSGEIDYDDAFISDKSKVELPADEIRRKLDLVPDPDDHDHWFQIGMALYHQFDGSDEGLQMWHQWSAQAHNYDMDALDARWTTFDVEGKKREPITARYILKHAKAEEDRLAGEALDEIKSGIDLAEGYPAIRAICETVKRTAFDQFQRDMIAVAIQRRLKTITSTTMAIGSIRNMVRYENPENTATPAWMEPFVYVQHTESFYNQDNRQTLSRKAFDDTYGRYMLTKKDRLEGKSTPEHTPGHAALHRYEIITVANVMYLPGMDAVFEIAGQQYVNGFHEDTLPKTAERISKRGRVMVDRFLAHVEHLYGMDRDAKLLLSWIAHIIQTNGRSGWCPVLQGVEGDGKTSIATLVALMLGGPANAVTINGDSLAEKYTPWAENNLFCFVEEVRLHGQDRYAVINKIKPFITNKTVPIRRMQTDLYNVVNTVNYLMASNFKDAIPMDDNSTRYFPLFSKWQAKKHLDVFDAENPNYYSELAEIYEYVEDFRRFFMDYELHEEFHPEKRATVSAARAEMIALNRAPEDDVFESIIEEANDPLVCEALLDPVHFAEVADEVAIPYGRAGNSWLSEKGWTFLGRFKLDGKNRRLWSQTPERFKMGSNDVGRIARRIRHFYESGGDTI